MLRISVCLLLVILLPCASLAASKNQCRKQFYGQDPRAPKTCAEEVMEHGNPETGNPEVQQILGDIYFWGWGDAAKRDYKEAVLWYKRAAIKGNISAKFSLGVLYENGKGIATDYARAIKWYTSAAKVGHANSQFNLANMYSKGAGTRQNQQRASYWYQKAANQGDPEAAYNMGNRYARGLGVKPDLAEAYKWYLISYDATNDADSEESIKFLKENLTPQQLADGKMLAKNWSPKRENPKIVE